MKILDEIKKVSRIVPDTELKKLQIEEELLLCLVTNSNVEIDIKKQAFKRIEVINKEQLKILGHS